MNERRRRFLCCLGVTGIASVTGCLRSEQNQSSGGERHSRSATSTEPDSGGSGTATETDSGGSGTATETGSGGSGTATETGSGGSETATEAEFSVSVIGRQFRWEFAYPEFDVSEQEELVLPVDASVNLEVRSEDVLHGFGVESLDIRADAQTDTVTQTTVTPEETGEYEGFCYEYCGAGHSEMTAPVCVVSESEFENWIS